MSNEQQAGDPTPDEIAAMCLAIQSRWTEKERRRRCAWACQREVVRVVEISEGEILDRE